MTGKLAWGCQRVMGDKTGNTQATASWALSDREHTSFQAGSCHRAYRGKNEARLLSHLKNVACHIEDWDLYHAMGRRVKEFGAVPLRDQA